jgi:glutamate N-acetyltransferase/amino-acid N-acetyltransferase
MQNVLVCKAGLAAPFSEANLKEKLNAKECEIRVTLGERGKGTARFWTCDLTEGYIRINASYRT